MKLKHFGHLRLWIFSQLLDERKGPVQFLVTYVDSLFNPSFTNTTVARLPFALASLLAIFFFYKFIEIHWGKRVAFFGSFFLATNGFVVAFGRIVQYQSFVILFMCMALYFLSLAARSRFWKIIGIYLGLIFWAFSILSHYDGVFIAPFVGLLLINWFRRPDISKKLKLIHFFNAGFISIICLSLFYIPFALSVSNSTLSYWEGRIAGTGGKESSSIYLFRVYQPIYVIHIYLYCFIFGIFSLITSKYLPDISLIVGMGTQLKGNIKGLKDFFITNKKEAFRTIALLIWVLVPFIFMEVFVQIPGTHIFTYLIPAMIVIGLGVDYLLQASCKYLTTSFGYVVGGFIILMFFSFIYLQTYQIFVDHAEEYPWEPEQFYNWNFAKPNATYHLSLFGFPYYRRWSEIGQIVMSKSDPTASYSSNERETITRYYVPLKRSADSATTYVYINDPQSYNTKITNPKIKYLVERYPATQILFLKDKEVARIYDIPHGTLDELIKQGF